MNILLRFSIVVICIVHFWFDNNDDHYTTKIKTMKNEKHNIIIKNSDLNK